MVSIEIFQHEANNSIDKLSTCSLNLNADCPKIASAFNIAESIFKLFLLQKYRPDIFHQGRNRNTFTFCGLLRGIFVHFSSCIGSLIVPEKEMFLIRTHLFFQTRFSKTTDLITSFKIWMQSFLLSLEYFVRKIVDFFPCIGFLMDQKCHKVLLV